MSNHGSRACYKRGCRCELCAEANRLYYAHYRENNRERVRKHNKEWKARNPGYDHRYYEENLEQFKVKKKQYAEEHRNEKKAYEVRYYIENIEKFKAKARAWEQNNRERYRELTRKSASNRLARKKNQFVESIDPQVVFERDEGICGICDKPIIGKFHIDHITPISKGGLHAYDNVQTAHPTCNMRKGSKFQEEICQISK